MSITNCISFLCSQLVTILESDPVFPFVGFAFAALILDFIISFVRR